MFAFNHSLFFGHWALFTFHLFLEVMISQDFLWIIFFPIFLPLISWEVWVIFIGCICFLIELLDFFFSWRETVFETMSILLFGLLRNFEKREVIKKEKSEPLFLVGFIRREVSIQLSIFGSRFPLSRNKSRKKKNVIIFILFSYFHFSLQPNRGLLFLFDSCVSVHICSFRRYGSSSKSDVLYSGWQVFDLILGCSPDISIPFIIWSVCIFLCKVLDSFTERSRLWGLVFIQCEISYLWNGRKKDYCLRFFWFILWVIV